MKLFDTAKVGVFCDGIRHHNETRKSGDAKVITLQLRVFPFDHTLAHSLASIVRTTLFELNHPNPKSEIAAVEFKLQTDRQKLLVFASHDTAKATICFDEVKIWHVKVKRRNDSTVYSLTLDATFGPCGDKELAYAEAWRGTQKSVTFEAAEPTLDFEDDTDDDEDETADTAGKGPSLPLEGTCLHGARVGEVCETCEGGAAIAQAPDPVDDREHARPVSRRHPQGTKKPQAPRSARTTH